MRTMESGGNSSGGSHNVIPEVMEAVRRTSRNIEDVEANLEEFLSYCDKETLSDSEPLERANVLLMIAKANTTLFALRLRCKGVDPDSHHIKREFERLSLYEEKLTQCMDLNKAPLRPSTTINPQAAARFIEHSLPDLSREQKQSMREVSRGRAEGLTIWREVFKRRENIRHLRSNLVVLQLRNSLRKHHVNYLVIIMLQKDLYSYNLSIQMTSRKL